MLNKAQREAMRHPNVLGAGAKKRKRLAPKLRAAVIQKELQRGTLHSGSGQIVTKPAQARAIIRSETKRGILKKSGIELSKFGKKKSKKGG